MPFRIDAIGIEKGLPFNENEVVGSKTHGQYLQKSLEKKTMVFMIIYDIRLRKYVEGILK